MTHSQRNKRWLCVLRVQDLYILLECGVESAQDLRRATARHSGPLMVIASVCKDSYAAVVATHRFIARVRSQSHSSHPFTDVRARTVTTFRAAAGAGCQVTPGDCEMSTIAADE